MKYSIIALLLLSGCTTNKDATEEEKSAYKEGIYELKSIKLDSCE